MMNTLYAVGLMLTALTISIAALYILSVLDPARDRKLRKRTSQEKDSVVFLFDDQALADVTQQGGRSLMRFHGTTLGPIGSICPRSLTHVFPTCPTRSANWPSLAPCPSHPPMGRIALTRNGAMGWLGSSWSLPAPKAQPLSSTALALTPCGTSWTGCGPLRITRPS